MSGERSDFAYSCSACGIAVAALKEDHVAGPVRLCARCAPSDADILPLILHGFLGRLTRRGADVDSDSALTAALGRHLAGGLSDNHEDRERGAQDELPPKVSSG